MILWPASKRKACQLWPMALREASRTCPCFIGSLSSEAPDSVGSDWGDIGIMMFVSRMAWLQENMNLTLEVYLGVKIHVLPRTTFAYVCVRAFQNGLGIGYHISVCNGYVGLRDILFLNMCIVCTHTHL